MIVAVASGKGGTGKTTVATSLALAAGREVRLLDCDVEEPNCHLFLKASTGAAETVGLPVPVVDPELCNVCGICGDICEFNAIAVLPDGARVFPNLCHGCGACTRLCPEEAIREEIRPIGEVASSRVGTVELLTGRLAVGEALAPPVVREVRRRGAGAETVIVDAPPGTGCPVMASLRGADVALLVTEPTPFGLHDLTLAVEAVRRLGIPFGVVVNRAGCGDDRVQQYCRTEGIPLLLEIPQDRRIAEAYARGRPLVEDFPEWRAPFAGLLDKLARLAAAEAGPADGSGGGP
ncbi:MAG TPA: ATP-binding protein [Candidatus Sulfomarinibacteraceae bacterium]|nr:ATP-binding protein [Candidatus Sulfomarinibacteraceae bacterium]